MSDILLNISKLSQIKTKSTEVSVNNGSDQSAYQHSLVMPLV